MEPDFIKKVIYFSMSASWCGPLLAGRCTAGLATYLVLDHPGNVLRALQRLGEAGVWQPCLLEIKTSVFITPTS
jgi:hypothetical protein